MPRRRASFFAAASSWAAIPPEQQARAAAWLQRWPASTSLHQGVGLARDVTRVPRDRFLFLISSPNLSTVIANVLTLSTTAWSSSCDAFTFIASLSAFKSNWSCVDRVVSSASNRPAWSSSTNALNSSNSSSKCSSGASAVLTAWNVLPTLSFSSRAHRRACRGGPRSGTSPSRCPLCFYSEFDLVVQRRLRAVYLSI